MQMKEKMLVCLTDCYWGRMMSASLPTQVKACFNAMETSQFTFSFNPKFKVTPSDGKVMLAAFWDSHEVLLAHFQKHGKKCEFCIVL
jgi:hypothetical protein